MDLCNKKPNSIRKRKRNDSSSSSISSIHSSEKKSYAGILKFHYSSDNSSSSTHRQSYTKQNSKSSKSSSKAQTQHTFKSSQYDLASDKKKVHLARKKLSKRLEKWDESKQNSFPYYLLSHPHKDDNLSSDCGKTFVQALDILNSSSNEDDDNGLSTSTGHGRKSTSKPNRKKISSTSQSPSSKRKRRASASGLSDKDPDFGYEPPSAKRQQRVQSIYQSEPGSVASSVYSLPTDEPLLQQIDTESNSSNYNSTDTEYDDSNTIAGDDATIPDSPNSLGNSDDSDGGCHLHKKCSDHEFDEDCGNVSLEDEIISNIHSPYPAKFRRNGERTPAPSSLPGTKSNAILDSEETKKILFEEYVNSFYGCMTPAADNDPPRQCPLPPLPWANAHDVWQTMCKKDEEAACLRDSGMLERHPGLQPRMRAILLDWLIEVCEVYKLHRETYYLAVDYLDRYLTTKLKVQKTHLQLIGITCLFVAAKVEEIYPPKIGEFAYVTDGACQEVDILHYEVLLLQALDWDINPVTPMGWLGIYMQLNVNNRTQNIVDDRSITRKAELNEKENNPKASGKKSDSGVDEAFIYPQFSGFEFVQTAQLLDLCSLDVGMAHFPYSVLAAAAMSHTFNKETALRCSGLDWQTIQPCARWMEPFFKVVSTESEHLYLPEQNEQVSSKFGLGHICANISTDDSHIIQTHSITMTMFDRVTEMQEQLIKAIEPEASPAIGLICPEGLLTPPASSRKPLDVLEEDQTKTTTKSTTIPTTLITTAKSTQGNTISKVHKTESTEKATVLGTESNRA